MPANKDILLIVPPSRTYTQWLPFGLMHISSYLTAQGEDNDIIDHKAIGEREAFDRIRARVAAEKPRFIGVTCMVSEIAMVKELCLAIRQASPESVIVIGGPQPSSSPKHFIEFGVPFDYLVLGEGERTFHELVLALRAGRPPEGVNGLGYVRGGELKLTTARAHIEDLDTLPFPAYDKVDMAYYCRPNVWTIRPVYISSFNIFTVRGCCFQCNFCVEHTVFGRKVRKMSPARAAAHIEHVIARYKVDAIYFMDELFTLDGARIRELFRLLDERGVRIVFGCQTRVDLVDEDLARFMRAHGCLQIDFGIESGSPKMLEGMNKRTTLERIVKTGEICNRTGIRHLANMMLNLPGEEMADIEASLELAKRMRYNLVLWNVYMPFPGSGFGRTLELEDFETIMRYPAKPAIDLLERKYKFGSYSMRLEDLLDYLHRYTFHPKYFKFVLNGAYWRSMFQVMRFLIDPLYLGALLRSRRKLEYVTNVFKQVTTM
jgi:radical SAM superfamily enzyme YgiQ (UPF0313 family)